MVSLIKKYVSYTLCTVFGAGYFPVFPGTYASSLASLLVFLLHPGPYILLLSIIITFTIGILCTAEIERNDGKDPKHIVIDEVSGQWLTFVLISELTFLTVLLGFILFRLFDIVKPFGINTIQNKKSGWGVMLDDILAGFYSNIVLHLLIYSGITL